MKLWVKIVIALISATTIIVPAYWARREHTSSKPKVRSLSGIVRSSEGKPLPRALVVVAADSEVPMSTRTDSAGIFAVWINRNASSIRINVDSEGYEPFTKQQNANENTYLEIFLTKKPTVSDSKAIHRGAVGAYASGPGSTAVVGNRNHTHTEIGR